MSQVLFKSVTKTFRKNVIAVDNVTLEIKDREFFVILGPSGCGKSTLLRLVAGLEEPDSGEIYIGEKLVNAVEPRDRDIAMVFQNYALYPHMTVFENMAFALKLRRLPRDEIQRRVVEAARILGIEELLDRKPAEISGGQRQRVAVGRAIVRNPKVFLFDEPLSNLDAKMRVGMRAELTRLHQQLKTTVIYVTHDQVEAMTLGQRIAVMKNGKLLQVGDPTAIYNRPANRFVAGFIGSPPMNFFTGRITAPPLRFVHQSFTIDLPDNIIPGVKPEGEIVLGVRPEHIFITDKGPIKAEVEVTEQLGNEALVYIKIGTDRGVLRTNPDHAPHIGEMVNLTFETKKLHLFDPQSENRLN
ncbi:MAG: sn-glycerol-3-phosphate ABC transporter ATP-binding protein UgpC [candidate division WOR-3 bacterium]|jgi:multiple sugar transport system ATP-binding protein|nr:sn-glycerol-3-phosphate ABC transporter ATP-binding protein UgpC [candidate division WOR-3 bacterium]MCR4424221.1 sn-glycerol-3-phosphate ABC transporter ATP-binding protein UgpC [candidate division WOR-3 bacterium]MDH7519361.1 sn-glycerol-3-phosphate ABC transporter ATP-binding protein UgpC [bacterium]